MNNILKQIARALYQIVVVGIILLPLRIAVAVFGVCAGLMTIVEGELAFKMYWSGLLTNLQLGYCARAHWVKYGWNTPNSEEEADE